jgi:hypothetical protein
MYGRGDYYGAGDYYRGDILGTIGRALGGVVSRVAPVISRAVAPVVRTVTNVVNRIPGGVPTGGGGGGGGGGISLPMTGPPGVLVPGGMPPGMTLGGGPAVLTAAAGGAGPGKMPVPTVPGFPFPTPAAGGVMSPMGSMGECPKGYHVNKLLVRAYAQFRNRGSVTPGLMAQLSQPSFHVCVANRRMDVCNTRALKRSIRRFKGFAKVARRVITFTSPRAPKGKALARRRK